MHSIFAFKQLVRGWVKSLLWIVLLAAVICFLTVSTGQRYVSRQNIAAMDTAFTTAAVVDDIGFWRNNEHIVRTYLPDGSFFERGVDKSGDLSDPEISILETVNSLDMVKLIDYRQSSRAFSPNIFTIVHPLETLEAAIAREEASRSGDIDMELEVIARYGQPFVDWGLQEGATSAVFKARCVSVDVTTSKGLDMFSYIAIFEIDHGQSPALHPFHENFNYLEIAASGILPSLSLPFAVGKDYILAAIDLAPKIFIPQYSTEGGLAELCSEPEWFLRGFLQGGPTDIILAVPVNTEDEAFWNLEKRQQRFSPFTEDVAAALGVPYDKYPFHQVYLMDYQLIMSFQELTGSVADFLESEKGEQWRLAIETTNKNIHALSVVGTNNLQAIAQFNQRDALMLEGREFSQDEYDEGAKVCIISASLARENGLRLGDELRLSMQRTGYSPQYAGENVYWHQPNDFSSSFLEFAEEESYRIVGIYTAPEWDYHYNSFTPNTIFIPQKAFPKGIPTVPHPRCEERAGMLSLVLENGSKNAFLKRIAGTDLDGKVHVLDQGYDKIASQIWTLWREARSLFVVSSLVWGIVVVFFFLLVTRRLRPDMGIMVSLGVRRNHIRQFLLCYIVIISLCGLILGGTAGVKVFQEVMVRTYNPLQEAANDANLPLTLGEAASWLPVISTLLQGLILILVAVIISLVIRLNVQVLLKQGMRI